MNCMGERNVRAKNRLVTSNWKRVEWKSRFFSSSAVKLDLASAPENQVAHHARIMNMLVEIKYVWNCFTLKMVRDLSSGSQKKSADTDRCTIIDCITTVCHYIPYTDRSMH